MWAASTAHTTKRISGQLVYNFSVANVRFPFSRRTQTSPRGSSAFQSQIAHPRLKPISLGRHVQHKPQRTSPYDALSV